MHYPKKISLEWKLITDPALYNSAKAELIDYVRSLISRFDEKEQVNPSDSSTAIGYDFKRIYAFQLGAAYGAAFKTVETALEDLLDAEITDNSYRYEDELEDAILEILAVRFENMSYTLLSEDDRFLITTYQALKLAGFNFNKDETVATPPPRLKKS